MCCSNGNSGARTHERSFLYFLAAFDPSDHEVMRQGVHSRTARVPQRNQDLKEGAADSHNSGGLLER